MSGADAKIPRVIRRSTGSCDAGVRALGAQPNLQRTPARVAGLISSWVSHALATNIGKWMREPMHTTLGLTYSYG